MLVLVVNFAVSGRVRENFQATTTELTALRRSSSAVTASNENRRAVIEQFSRTLPYRSSRLSDRIGGATPEKITLTEISIAPLLKTPEPGKPVVQNDGVVVIRGETVASEAITEFVEALTRLRLGVIRLAGVEHDTGREMLTFRIELTV